MAPFDLLTRTRKLGCRVCGLATSAPEDTDLTSFRAGKDRRCSAPGFCPMSQKNDGHPRRPQLSEATDLLPCRHLQIGCRCRAHGEGSPSFEINCPPPPALLLCSSRSAPLSLSPSSHKHLVCIYTKLYSSGPCTLFCSRANLAQYPHRRRTSTHVSRSTRNTSAHRTV